MFLPKYTKRTGLALMMLASSGAAFAECGDIQIASMDWPSAELMAEVDKIILEEGYGCNIELVPGATTTTFASMNGKGQPDVAPELWTNAVAKPLAMAVSEGSLHIANPSPITDLGEGWWIPPHTAKAHPELKTVLDVIAHPELFPDKEDPSKGAFVTCPSGWGCQLNNANLFRAFEMESKGWKLVESGSAAGLDGSMAKAVERGESWFGYYWSPTLLIGKYGMVKLDFGVPYAGDENWNGCIAKPEQECDAPKPTAWTESVVNTVVTDNFKKSGGTEATEYIGKRIYPGAVMNQMLVYMGDNQAEGEDAAIEFLLKHGAVWESWVSTDAATKIKASL